MEQVETQFPGASDRVRFWEVLRPIMNLLVGGLIEGTVSAAQTAGAETVEDVRKLPYRIARMTPQTADLNARLKSLLVTHVYANQQLIADRNSAVQKLGELFEFLVSNPDRISAGYREHLSETPVHRVVCDYLAGMTDGYLMRTYDELIGRKLLARDNAGQFGGPDYV
jgi:dGTPase